MGGRVDGWIPEPVRPTMPTDDPGAICRVTPRSTGSKSSRYLMRTPELGGGGGEGGWRGWVEDGWRGGVERMGGGWVEGGWRVERVGGERWR